MINIVRRGRISDNERLLILMELGKLVQRRYNKNLKFGAHGYNLDLLKNSLKFSPNIEAFQNIYWIETGNKKLDEIANYFEYGTGLHNQRKRNQKGQFSKRTTIKAKTKRYMKFRKPWKGKLFMKEVKGVQPVWMMQKAVKSVEQQKENLQKKIRLKLGR